MRTTVPTNPVLLGKRVDATIRKLTNQLAVNYGLSLQSFEADNLRTYWEPWIEERSKALARKVTGEDADATVLAWGVLGSLRIACTLTTGRIVSKTEAGRWTLMRYPLEWHPVIQDALATRFGQVSKLPVPRCRRAVEFKRYVIADALAAARR